MLYPTILGGYTAVMGAIATVYDRMRSRSENLNQSMADLKSTLVKEMVEQAKTLLQLKPIVYMAFGMGFAAIFAQILTYFEMARYRKVTEALLQKIDERLDWLDTRVPRERSHDIEENATGDTDRNATGWVFGTN